MQHACREGQVEGSKIPERAFVGDPAPEMTAGAESGGSGLDVVRAHVVAPVIHALWEKGENLRGPASKVQHARAARGADEVVRVLGPGSGSSQQILEHVVDPGTRQH